MSTHNTPSPPPPLTHTHTHHTHTHAHKVKSTSSAMRRTDTTPLGTPRTRSHGWPNIFKDRPRQRLFERQPRYHDN